MMKCRGGIEILRHSKVVNSQGGFNNSSGCDWLLGRNRLLVRAVPTTHILASYIEQRARSRQTRNMHEYIAVQLRACGAEGSTARGHASIFGSDLRKRSWGPPTSAGLRVSQTHNGPHRRQIFVFSYFFFFSFFFYVLLATVIRQATYRPHSGCGLVVRKAFIRCVCVEPT